MMKKIELALCAQLALFAPAGQNAPRKARSGQQPVHRSRQQSPVRLDPLAGRPSTQVDLTSGANPDTSPYLPYCTPGGAGGGTPLMNSTGTVNTFSRFTSRLSSATDRT